MGLDFISKAAGSFHKGLDRDRLRLATPDLFSREPENAPRCYVADILSGTDLRNGEVIGIRLDGGRILATRGLECVAVFSNPPAELVNALGDACGVGSGTVQRIHKMAFIAEISVC